jgi:hypothetical protein
MSHKWPTKGNGDYTTYLVRAMATDNKGASGAWSDSVHVTMNTPYVNYPPDIPVMTGPTQGVSGTPYEFTVVSTDPNGDMIQYDIAWGDTSGGTLTALTPSGQPVTVSHIWTVPKGKTSHPSVQAMAIDQYDLANPNDSVPLILTITGPSVSAQVSGLEAEGDETVFERTEEADSVDAQTAENESIDKRTEEADSVDAQTAENESIDTQTEEADSVDAQTAENESIDTQTEEADSVDAQTAENESIDTQTEEADSVDAQTASPTRRQTEIANLTKLQSPSSEIAAYRMK